MEIYHTNETVGKTLNNGAEVLDADPHTNRVLCEWNNGTHVEYVVWTYVGKLEVVNGHYFEHYNDALKSFVHNYNKKYWENGII